LLFDSGELSSLAEGGDARTAEALPDRVVELCVRDQRPVVLTCAGRGCATWTLRIQRDEGWVAGATIPTEGDELLALSCQPGPLLVVTSRRLVTIADGRPSVVRCSEPIRSAGITTVHTTDDRIFVGLNSGEWGGGLRAVDRRTGQLRVLERNASGELCGGPLNTECDPVNGIATPPWKPDCLVAAIGLVHFASHGRLVEICGDGVRSLFFQPLRGPAPASPDTPEPFETVSFFGLVRQAEVLWAVGIDGLYRLDASGVVKSHPLPRFKVVDGVAVSFDLPGVVLVLTDVNQRHSISGRLPMLVPR
jgi:hypothetical protein